MIADVVLRTTPIQTVRVLCTPPEWTRKAACLDEQDLFDLTFNTRRKIVLDRAVSFCLGCPVVDECLAKALTMERGLSAANRYGVQGAATPTQRAAMAPV